MRSFLLFLGALIISTNAWAQSLSTEEQKLYDLIMEERALEGLPNIPLSKSLTMVAQTHARDLENHQPDAGECNLHSWSDQGDWTPCCYTPDHAQAQCMWDKPREITDYTGNGFEISYWSSRRASAEEALDSWRGSSGHYAVIMNQGTWDDNQWQAMGIGLYGTYGVVWFGTAKDVE
ncbi:MAG TPA: CAP domain-containing protein [Cytophagales bacterium]|nr:CAP domain-containing protein [Cytophagales bacterium]HAP59981.1 CAP domain-containing protein [Cytophagales bacterium]